MKNSEFEGRQEGYLSQINAALAETLASVARPIPPEYDAARRAMEYSLGAGGKRIRPMLTLEFARLFGGTPEKALPLACAVEMVHTYSLIHDDLPCMDDDDLRRGKPACHIRFGEANALLAGDALLTLAFETIASAPGRWGADAAACIRASAALARLAGIGGMIGGQVMDLENEGKAVDEETLLRTDSLKTSALLQAACQMGALSAGADDAGVEAAGDYAGKLGIAFQIVDDILDVIGEEAALGKPVGSDAESGKSTYVTLLTLEGAKERAEKATSQALEIAKKLPDNEFLLELTRRLLKRGF